MTATIETIAPVVMTTADGESRPASMWGHDSYTCTFCQSPVYGPADWEKHEQDNADHYAKRGESYTAEPYSYRARYWEARECANPMCVSALTGEHLESYRASERARLEREAREQAHKDAEAERKAAIEQAQADARAAREAVRGQAELAGFAWTCYHVEREATTYSEREACSEQGTDRAAFVEHFHGHGGPASVTALRKAPRLKRKAPAAKLPALPCNPFKFITWHEVHSEPGTCTMCGHSGSEHCYGHAGLPGRPGCNDGECDCTVSHVEPIRQEARRRGQFWGNGPRPRTVWVMPLEPAPWETGRPAAVSLWVDKNGSFSA